MVTLKSKSIYYYS